MPTVGRLLIDKKDRLSAEKVSITLTNVQKQFSILSFLRLLINIFIDVMSCQGQNILDEILYFLYK